VRLIIGTPQFGMPYGIADSSDIPKQTVNKILAKAVQIGCCTLDTSPLYGEAETRIGDSKVEGLLCISKLPTVNTKGNVATVVEDFCNASLRRLRKTQLEAYLCHDPNQLRKTNAKSLVQSLNKLKETGKTKKIGVSIYTEEQLLRCLELFTPDVVQAPVNLVDRTFCMPKIIEMFIQKNIELHARSIFLQGLLLTGPDQLRSYFSRWKGTWQILDAWFESEFDGDRVSGCVEITKKYPHISALVAGVRTEKELEKLAVTIAKPVLAKSDLPQTGSTDIELTNPSYWRI